LNVIEKYQPVIILSAVVIGLVIGQVGFIKDYTEHFITPFLVVMLYGVFLQIPIREITKAFKNIKCTFTSLTINFIWTPLLAWILGTIFLKDSPAIWLGFIMLLVTPCTDWYLIFTDIAKGNVAISTAVLPLNLVIQLLLLPLYLFV